MPMLWRGELKGCDLLVAAPLTKEQRKVLHPACQCMSRPQNIPGTARIARGGGLISDVATAKNSWSQCASSFLGCEKQDDFSNCA